MEKPENDSIQSVMRAFEVIEVLAESSDGLGVTQIAKLTGLSKTTAFRMLNTLIQAGYVQKRYGESVYRLGMKFLKISSAILEGQDIRDIARPYLRKLSDTTKEIVHLAIIDGNEVVYIDKIEGSQHTMRIFSTIGKRSPMHCTGLGKVLLSGLSSKEVDRIISTKGLKRYTDCTITNAESIKKELELIRKRGYAFDEMEHEIGVWCVAAPVFGRHGEMTAAISVTAPEIYLADENKDMFVQEVLSAAEEISYQLGYSASLSKGSLY